MYDLVIVNGEVITSESKSFKDIAIKDGKIAEIVERGTLDKTQLQGAEVYDASGKCVIPGLVEPHMHIKAPLGGFTDILDFDSASKCAAFGGVTTFIDFTSTLPGDSLLKAVEDRKKEMAKAKLDYSCHCKVVNLVTTELASEANLAEVKFAKTKSDTDKKTAQTAVAKVEQAINDRLSEIPKIIKDEGIPTFKLFMTYRKANVMIDDTYMLKVLAEIKKYGGRCGFHAESNAIAEYNEELFAQKGTLDWKYFPECKNNLCEAEAVKRVLYYAKLIDVPIYFFHLTTKESVALVRKAKQEGVDVIAETCTHYLTLTKDKNDGDDGILYLMSPPLRTEEDQDALWDGLRDGTLSLVSSDNCTFTRKQKEAPLKNGERDFRKPINGVSGIEERFTLMRHAVNDGKISERDFVKLLCENPAKVFGCYPQKGCLKKGSDADIVIYDPDKTFRLLKENLHYPNELEYSIYSDFDAKGCIESTIRRGEFLVKKNEWNDSASQGKFLRRTLSK